MEGLPNDEVTVRKDLKSRASAPDALEMYGLPKYDRFLSG